MDPKIVVVETLVTCGVSASLYGMFILLCGASVYSLVKRNNRRARPATLTLSLVLLALFASTTIFTVTSLIYGKQVILFAFDTLHTQMSQLQMINCATSATFTLNIVLGDAIVCWRACVVWQWNRFITGTCVALLLATLTTGTVDTQYDCTSSISVVGGSNLWRLDQHATESGSTYRGFSYGAAASVLSLSTNLYATAVVALKAWKSRRILKRYIVTGSMVSQTGKVLSILVESGAVYCAIWVIVVAYQVGMFIRNPYNAECLSDAACANTYYHSFWYIFAFIINGGLMHLVAIYPTTIIMLVALNYSHMENGFTKNDESSMRPCHCSRPMLRSTRQCPQDVTPSPDGSQIQC